MVLKAATLRGVPLLPPPSGSATQRPHAVHAQGALQVHGGHGDPAWAPLQPGPGHGLSETGLAARTHEAEVSYLQAARRRELWASCCPEHRGRLRADVLTWSLLAATATGLGTAMSWRAFRKKA